MGLLNFNRDVILSYLGWNIPTIFLELFDAIIICLALGYIFYGVFTPLAKKVADYDPLAEYRGKLKNKRSDFWMAVASVAPGVILHELGHKFVAMLFGYKSVFYASYSFLGIGVLLKLIGSPFLFFVPAYVTHPASFPHISALIAIAGPLINLFLWGIAKYLIKNSEKYKFGEKTLIILNYTKTVNIFLFFFNMLPIPPFDGFTFFYWLFLEVSGIF